MTTDKTKGVNKQAVGDQKDPLPPRSIFSACYDPKGSSKSTNKKATPSAEKGPHLDGLDDWLLRASQRSVNR